MRCFILICLCLFTAIASLASAEEETCNNELVIREIVDWESATITGDPLMPIKMYINPDPEAPIQEVFVTFGYMPLEGVPDKKQIPVLMQYRDGESYCLLSFTYESLEEEEPPKKNSI